MSWTVTHTSYVAQYHTNDSMIDPWLIASDKGWCDKFYFDDLQYACREVVRLRAHWWHSRYHWRLVERAFTRDVEIPVYSADWENKETKGEA